MALAYDNKSHSSDATAGNGSRKLVRDGSGNYHLVFASGGEVYYRKNTGGNWNDPQRMSSGNGENQYPCITEKSGKVYITWQRHTGGNTYDIHFAASTNGGSSWAKNYKLTDTGTLSGDPLPVIQASVTSANHLMIVYRDGKSPKGLSSFYTANSNPSSGNWTKEFVIGTDQNSATPTLTATPFFGTTPAFALSWQSSTGTLYYQYYMPTLGWNSKVNMSTIVPGSATHQMPSISNVPGGNPLHLAWHRTTGSDDDVIIHRRASSYSGFLNEYFMTFFELQSKPTISGYSLSKADLLFEFGPGSIFIQHFTNGSWGSIINKGAGTNPSLSMGQSQAKYVWTSGSSSPYSINLSAETLSKTGETIEPHYARSVTLLDSTGAYLQVIVKRLEAVLKDGSREAFELKPVVADQLDSLDFIAENIWQWQSTLPKQLPVDVDSLIVTFTVDGRGIENVIHRGSGEMVSRFQITDAQDNPMRTVAGAQFATTGDIAPQVLAFRLAGGQLPGTSSPVRIKITLDGLTARENTFASLGHLYDYRSPASASAKAAGGVSSRDAIAGNELQISAVYPNPFNPSTTLRYTLPEPALVMINIYNILGEPVRRIANSPKAAGVHEIVWNGLTETGQQAASGIYIVQLVAKTTTKRELHAYQKIILTR